MSGIFGWLGSLDGDPQQVMTSMHRHAAGASPKPAFSPGNLQFHVLPHGARTDDYLRRAFASSGGPLSAGKPRRGSRSQSATLF
jgi:hypothetical protein